MRILFLSDVYFPRVNGVSTSIRTIRRELCKLGHQVLVVAPGYEQFLRADEEKGIVRVAARAVPFDPEDRLMDNGVLRQTLARIPEGAFDLVHVHTPFAAHYAGVRFAHDRGLPCVATYHTFFEEYLHHYIPFVPRALTRAFARWISCSQGNQVDALVVPSRAMLSTLTAYGVRKPMAIVPTGVPLDEFSGGEGAAFRRRHGIPAERPLLVHIGRVAFEKNIEFLLRVLARVRSRHRRAMLLVSGEGPALARLKRMSSRMGLGDDVVFVGYQDRATSLLDCYRAADIFVFASRTETQGLVLLEALALGVPMVAISEMGAVDILEAGKGVLTVEPDEQRFADGVCMLLESAELRSALAAGGSQYARQWDATRLTGRLVDFYIDVLSHASGAIARRFDSGTGTPDIGDSIRHAGKLLHDEVPRQRRRGLARPFAQ